MNEGYCRYESSVLVRRPGGPSPLGDVTTVWSGALSPPTAAGTTERTRRPNAYSPRPSSSAGRIPCLDGIRGIAILLVLLRHGVIFGNFTTQSAVDGFVNTVAKTGWVGVDLFFVLSGFLITGILYDTRSDGHYFRTFYMRRVLRIMPVYYAFLLLYFVAGPRLVPGVDSPELSWGALTWAASYLANYPTGVEGWGVLPHPLRHTWSLAIEEQFYLFWPLLIYRLSRRRLMAMCLAAAGLGWCVRAGLLGAGLDIAGYVWTPARLGPLALGGFVALAMRDADDRHRITRWAGPVAVTMLALIGGILLWQRNLEYGMAMTQLVVFDALAVLFGAVIVLSLTSASGGLLSRCSSLAVLRFFGRYSYAIYLFHQPVLLALRGVGLTAGILPAVAGSHWPGALAFVMVGSGASLAVALVSWHLVEKHFLRLKDRFAYG